MFDNCVYLKGAKEEYCEDAVYACTDFAFVLDGATGVDGAHITDRPTDVVWFVEKFCAYLKAELHADREIIDILGDGAEKIGAQYKTFFGAESVRDKPSAAVSVVRARKGYLEYYSLCDSVILIRRRDGNVSVIMDERLVALDNANFDRMKKIAAEKGKTVRESFFDIFPYLLENRLNMNKPGGYAALSSTRDALDTALMGKIPLAEVSDLLLFTDGLAESYDLFSVYASPEALLRDVSQSGIRLAVSKLHAVQDKDPDCEKFVRNKKCDDIAAVYTKIK